MLTRPKYLPAYLPADILYDGVLWFAPENAQPGTTATDKAGSTVGQASKPDITAKPRRQRGSTRRQRNLKRKRAAQRRAR